MIEGMPSMRERIDAGELVLYARESPVPQPGDGPNFFTRTVFEAAAEAVFAKYQQGKH